MRIVHVVSQHTRLCGYSRRTFEIVSAQRQAGLQPETCAWHDGPFMQSRLNDVLALVCTVTGWSADRVWAADSRAVLMATTIAVGLEARMLRPVDVLHAHTPWMTAVAASFFGPFVYEVRGLQEVSAMTTLGWDKTGDRFLLWRLMETWARQTARVVCAISPALAEDARVRGARKVFLTPNAVDSTRFEPSVRDALAPPVFGYVGSLTWLEGVDWLVEHWPSVRAAVPGARLRVVGPGTLTAAPGEGVEVSSSVEPSLVPALLRELDAVIIPRSDSPVTRMVTPLKPLEALASGTPVISADLPALRFVGAEGTLFYKADDASALAGACVDMLPRRKMLGASGRLWVERERTWDQVVQTQRTAYESAA